MCPVMLQPQGETKANQVQAVIAGEIEQTISVLPGEEKHGPRLATFLV